MKIKSRSVLCISLSCLFFPADALATGSIYLEPGRPGVPASWMTPEFNRQWGLGAINAQYAYARGYNGQGVSIGILDEKLFPHPEFAGKLRVVSNFLPYDFDTDKKSIIITFGKHGVHVSGIAAANRDGVGMHGVAFGATLATGSIPYANSQLEFMTQSNVRMINNSWGDDVPIEKDAAGEELVLPNGEWKFKQLTAASQIDALTPFKDNIDTFSQRPIPTTIPDEIKDFAHYAGMLRAARHGKLIIFAAGNANNYNVPTTDESLPYLFPEVLDRYLTVTNLAPNNDLAVSSSSCGHTASYCVSAPGTEIYSAVGHFVSRTGNPITKEALNRGELSVVPGYKEIGGTSMAAPHVTGAAAILMQRFPYMTAEQISTVLKTTTTDLGALGIDARFGWGKINLRDAIDGPKMFIAPADIPTTFYVPSSYTNTQFVANIPGIGTLLDAGTSLERRCTSPECDWDVWRNNIAGHGGLTKEGRGTLVMNGTNTYAGTTKVNQGRLEINGSVISDVSVRGSGIVGGNGTVGSLTAHSGGIVAPGNSIGSMNVIRNVSFKPGSLYAVEVGPNGQSDRILSYGSATIDGGEVAVMLENSNNLLTQSEVCSLLGQQYNILRAQQGLSGHFDAVVPNYLFLGSGLNYQPNEVTLSVGRNDISFVSVAKTQNERAVAEAADALTTGNPVYESILSSGTVGEARKAFSQLSGQIHADIASALVNDSRFLREALNGRLRQAEGLVSSSVIKANESGAWVQLTGAWSHASGDDNATGYQASTYGVLLGLDSALADDWRLGVATGYTRTSLQGGYGAKADSDNYHLAAYVDKQFGALALRGGAGYTWHSIDTKRSVNYGIQSDRDTAKYNARTEQLFAEAGYSVNREWVNLEPFVNLAYVNFKNNSIAERGGAAAFHGDKQHIDTTVSTLGLRVDTEWQVSNITTVALRSELGWQHQYGNLDRGTGLRFKGGNAPFVVNNVPVSRDGMALKAGVEVAMNVNATLSLGYSGLLSQNHQDNSVNAGFTWRF